MQDPALVFEKLDLREGDTFLDLGCGAGDYSLHAAGIVGESGRVFAVDLWEEMLDKIRDDAMARGIHNVYPVISDIQNKIEAPDKSADICLISHVLHSMDFPAKADRLFGEVRRVLKAGGKLAIVECKKEKSSFGPPIELRISPEELERHANKFKFNKTGRDDLGLNYILIFNLNQE
ncbi:MAG: methyltransferase domain-containing protein [Dethiosulfovibrio sp.]|nr:methyltransferase domain-containing protein [Dethiosulfovibrio sp.]